MTDFKIIELDPETRKVTINPGFVPRRAAGLDKLVQLVVFAIYNNTGRNVFYPSEGSGLLSLIGTANISASEPTEALALVTERIEKIREELLADQNGIENASLSERLSDLQVLSVESGVQIDEIIVKLRLVSEAGDQIVLAI